jgi:hypothetical protein
MNLRYASLLCGIALIAAMPVLADRMSNYRNTNDSFHPEIIAGLKNADGRDANSSLALGIDSAATLDADAHSGKLSDSGFYEHAHLFSESGRAWEQESDGDREGDGDSDGNQNKSGTPTSVPEPSSLSLFLIGLAGIGFFALRRGEKQRTISAVRGL